MTENVRCESNLDKSDKAIESNNINYRKLVYNKRLSGKFKLYLSNKMAYKQAFDLIAKKTYMHH